MATARKKQDEKNLKTLRELVSLVGNKHCFDCKQRGPTYINMTIGSFICTKCSGMLRGLTPPHRVKSISMASFTTEEVDLVKSKGNEYCRQTWLGLYDQNQSSELDEQEIKDFMIEKYEKKLFYLEPSKALKNGTLSPPVSVPQKLPATKAKPVRTIHPIKTQNVEIKSEMKPLTNGTAANSNGRSDFVADFSKVNMFASSQFNNNTTAAQSQPSFANFDNNPIFNATNMPQTNTVTNNVNNAFAAANKPARAPSEDRYAALKDLDNALKVQQQDTHLEWSTNSSNGSGYVSPAQSTGSLYGSPSTTGSMYGSPSQTQFTSVFPQEISNNTSNPFSSNNAQSPWATNGNTTVVTNSYNGFNANPFRSDNFNGTTKFSGTTNGYNNGNQISSSQPFQQNLFSSSQSTFMNNKPWNMPNPFAQQSVTPINGGFSNNPFL